MASSGSSSSSKPNCGRTQIRVARNCLCSPTSHPGSFRCSLHRLGNSGVIPGRPTRTRSNSLENGQVVTRKNTDGSSRMASTPVLAYLLLVIRPSTQGVCRRRDFQAKPTRFCLMNSNPSGGQIRVSVS